MSDQRADSNGKKKRTARLEQIFTVRVPASFEAELDGFVEAMQTQVPWVRLTRADALRWLLEDGLKIVDEQLTRDGRLGSLPDR